MWRSSLLANEHSLRHGFLGRKGGVSHGIYESLNVGYQSNDKQENIEKNRDFALNHLDMQGLRLMTPKQTHSTTVTVIQSPEDFDASAEADALVTNIADIALGIQTADCAPLLLYAPQSHVVAAAHAGWKGALNGILEQCISKMEQLGADRSDINVAIGPCISMGSYEIDIPFYQTFVGDVAAYQTFFSETDKPGKFLFDLPGFIRFRLYNCGVMTIDEAGIDTYTNPDEYFSYRRAIHNNDNDYGRQLSAIALLS